MFEYYDQTEYFAKSGKSFTINGAKDIATNTDTNPSQEGATCYGAFDIIDNEDVLYAWKFKIFARDDVNKKGKLGIGIIDRLRHSNSCYYDDYIWYKERNRHFTVCNEGITSRTWENEDDKYVDDECFITIVKSNKEILRAGDERYDIDPRRIENPYEDAGQKMNLAFINDKCY